MNEKVKRMLVAVAALAALALGGAGIASATSGGSSTTATEQNDPAAGTEAGGDGDQSVSASVDQRARAAAEQATGGAANGDVEPSEQPNPTEDQSDSPPPKGAAYEVEVTKGGQALKVFLDSSLKVLDTIPDAG